MRGFLKVLYDLWMKFARILAKVQTTIILFLIYFICIGIISLIAFIFRKNFLDKTLSDKSSFWQNRLSKVPTLDDCKRQF